MRSNCALTACLAVLALAIAAPGMALGMTKPSSRRSSNSTTIQLFKSIGPVSLGMAPEQVDMALGAPQGKQVASGGEISNYYYIGTLSMAITFDVAKNDRAEEIQLTEGPYVTPQGIHLGSTKRQVKQAYKKLRCFGSNCTLRRGARSTRFGFGAGGLVVEIAVAIHFT